MRIKVFNYKTYSFSGICIMNVTALCLLIVEALTRDGGEQRNPFGVFVFFVVFTSITFAIKMQRSSKQIHNEKRNHETRSAGARRPARQVMVFSLLMLIAYAITYFEHEKKLYVILLLVAFLSCIGNILTCYRQMKNESPPVSSR